MKTVTIDRKKIDPSRVYKGKKGEYYTFVLVDRPDDYGNAGFVAHETTKEERASGIRGAIVGNWKEIISLKDIAQKAEKTVQGNKAMAIKAFVENDDIPF